LTPGLSGLPVVACDLHSQVGAVTAAFHRLAPDRRLVYVMTDSAALPMALSDLVAELRDRGWLASTVSSGQAFGGDHEAVNLPSGLTVAQGYGAADAVVVGPGPGVVGTGSVYGFTGIEVAAAVNAAVRLGGRAIVAVRFSDADGRDRHRGVSHHTTTSLGLASTRPLVPVPAGSALPGHGLGPVLEVEVPGDLEFCGTSMGRGPADDPGLFRWAAAAGVLAATLLA
jgi:hypothetical protein